MKKNFNQNLCADDIQNGQIVTAIYDGTNFQVFLQKNTFWFALDSGSANAYAVAYTPTLTAHVVGLPLQFKASHSNTGLSTFNPGPGAVEIKRWDGSSLQAGDIPVGGMIDVVYDGQYYQLKSNIVQFPALLAVNGYEMSPSGLIRQWGKYDADITSETPIQIYFNTSFTSAVYNIQLTGISVDSNSDMWPQVDYNNAITNTYFYVRVQWSGSSGTEKLKGFYWRAEGK